MPEMNWTVQWPDGQKQSCYSPSLVMHDYFEVGQDYSVDDFVTKSRNALGEASERVRAKYGMACTSAMAQLAEIENVGETYTSGTVRILGMTGSDLL